MFLFFAAMSCALLITQKRHSFPFYFSFYNKQRCDGVGKTAECHCGVSAFNMLNYYRFYSQKPERRKTSCISRRRDNDYMRVFGIYGNSAELYEY